MAKETTMTVRAVFDTRAAADLAIDHLVQQFAIARSRVHLRTDTGHNEAAEPDDVGQGEVEISADISPDRFAAVQRSLGKAGALFVTKGRASRFD